MFRPRMGIKMQIKTPVQPETRFCGSLLGISIGRGFGALERVKLTTFPLNL